MIDAIKHIVIIFSFIFLNALQSYAQKNDYVWLGGYGSGNGGGLYFGTSVMDFNYDPVKITYHPDSLSMYFNWTNTSFSDSDGNLLFYTNAVWIANSTGDTIQNGDSLNWGIWMQYGSGDEGYPVKQGIYALQSLTNSNQYYIIYSTIDTNGESCGALLCTLLDMSLNQGRGQVIYKNQVLLNDKIGPSFTITRHGNGKYWWIIAQKRNTNCYYRLLLDETGPHLIPDSVCGGTVYPINDNGAMNFSEDGSKLISLGYRAGLNIFDFDRCTGEISSPVSTTYPYLADSGWWGGGAATSPDSRFLYISIEKYIFQYDLTATDILGSVDTVGIFDGFNAPFPAGFVTAQNGPDGKIYVSCGNADSVYNVINNPNRKGDSCNLVQHGVDLPSVSWGIPSYPNFRLGALTGSACDTLTGLNEIQRAAQEQIIKVYPNPATDYAIVDYGFTDWSKPQPNLEICNTLGQVVYQQVLPTYSGLQKIDVSGFAGGMYMVFIKRENAVIATSKLVKQ